MNSERDHDDQSEIKSEAFLNLPLPINANSAVMKETDISRLPSPGVPPNMEPKADIAQLPAQAKLVYHNSTLSEYERLIESANAPIFGIDTLGFVNVWNQKAKDFTGFTREDMMGKHLVETFVTREFKDSVSNVLQNALDGVEMANFQFPMLTKNNTRIEILLNATSRRDDTGKIIGVIGIGQDITSRIAQEREYQNLIHTANAPIFGIDLHGVVNVWNQTASTITKYGTEDVMGHRLVDEFITPEYQASVERVLEDALRGEETANFEFPLTTKDGSRVDILLNASSRRDEKGNIVGVIGIGQDITARIAQEREYEKLIDTANAPIFGIDKEGVVNVWNRNASGLTGFLKKDVIGKKLVEEFISEEYQTSVEEVLKKALEGDEMANFEFPIMTKAGKRLDILLNATTRRDVNGSICGVIGIGQDITARIAQEKEYEKLIDTANAPIFGIDVNGIINVWNKTASKITGYTKEEVMGQRLVEDYITADYQFSVQNVLSNALEGYEMANFEFPLITKWEKRVEILLNATSRRDEQGTIVGVIGIGQDITARIAQEREYEKLIDTANAPIFGIDVDGIVNVWNQKACDVTGYIKASVLGHKLVEEYITDDFKDSVQEVLDQALEGVEMTNFEFPIITKSGKRVDILLNATSRRDETGAIIGVIGIGQDITARIAQEREYERLIDTANAPIFGIDLDGVVNVWNQNACNLTGYTKDEVIGHKLVDEFITDDYKESVENVLVNALKGYEMANFEFPIVSKRGKKLDILLNATTRRDETGGIIGVIGIGQDITARIAQELEYVRLIDTANAPIFGIDVNGVVNVWNNRASNITGFTQEEVMGRKLVEEFITDDFQSSVQNVLAHALDGMEMANFEFPIITKTGKRVDILLNATSRRDETGAIIGVIGIGQDITARIAQEREYEKLIDTANAPIFGIDVDGIVNVWNQRASDVTGFTKEDVIGTKLVENYITDSFKDSVQGVLTRALEGIEESNFEFPLVTKSGQQVDILLNATSRRHESGAIIGVIGIGQDITARIAQEKEYERLIDTANAPIFGIDEHGVVNVWNHKACDLTFYPKEDVIGHKLVEEFITDDYKESVQEVLTKALQGQEMANFEFPIITKSGKRVDVLLNATSRRDEWGNIVGVIGIGQDITARIASEREYEKLIDTANAPIFGIDRHGIVNVWNMTASKITGFSTDDVMGRKLVEEFITSDFQESVQIILNNALAGTETANYQFPIITKTKQRVEILLNASSRRDETGAIVGVIGIGQDITARIAQEKEYEKLIDTANAPIFGINKEGIVNVWNVKASIISGFGRDEVLGRRLVKDFITDDYQESVQNVLNNALQGLEMANFEFPIITKQGNSVDILLNATSRRDEMGSIIGVIGIGQDITARIAQEKEYVRLIETANAPIFGIDTEGVVNVWNMTACNITGFSNEEVMGRKLVEEYITEDFQASVHDVLQHALEGREMANFEFPIITKSGKQVDILLNATSRRDETGQIIGVIGIGQDITARIAQEREYVRLIDTANAPIFGIDTQGVVTVWNKTACNITGFSTDEVLGRNLVEEYITEDYKTSVQSVLDKALRGVETANFDFPLITKDGKRVEILLNATSRRDEHGNVIGVVGIGQDITEIRAARDFELKKIEAEAAEAAQRTVSAHVYHEIRNVVGAVLALADRACECVELAIDTGDVTDNTVISEATFELAKKIRQLTEHQRTVCQHAVDTLNDMLDVAKLEACTFIPKSDVVDLSMICHEAMQLQCPRLRPGVAWKLKVPPQGQAIVYSDRVLIIQFLTNLLSNAAKFTSKGGIKVFLEVADHPTRDNCIMAKLGVADSGPGIIPEDQERVLHAFTTGTAVPREDFDVTTRNTGCGLRLADLIVKALGSRFPDFKCEGIKILSPIPEDHEGYIKGGGSGTLLWFELPFFKAESSKYAAHNAKPACHVPGGGDPARQVVRYKLSIRGHIRVLVVDDQRTMRQMMAMLFQRLAQEHQGSTIEVHTALSAEEACRMACAFNFHVITVDEQLSEEYCMNICRQNATEQQKGAAAAGRPAAAAAAGGKGAAAAAATAACGAEGPGGGGGGGDQQQGGGGGGGGGWGKEGEEEEEQYRGEIENNPLRLVLEHYMVFGAEKHRNAKQRTEYFETETQHRNVMPGDGREKGHAAIKAIREFYNKMDPNIPRPILFNVTGNVLDADRALYLESGSNGVLAKPSNYKDLVLLLECNILNFAAGGLCKLEGDSALMLDGAQIAIKHQQENISFSSDGSPSPPAPKAPPPLLPPLPEEHAGGRGPPGPPEENKS